MCDDEESRAKAPAGADNDQPAVTTEVLSARASEGGASSSLAASPPNSPTFEVGGLAQQPCHHPPAEQHGFSLPVLAVTWIIGSKLHHYLHVSVLPGSPVGCSVGSDIIANIGDSPAHLQEGIHLSVHSSIESRLSPCYALMQMSDEEEARGRAPAGPDDSEPAGTPETVQSKSAEGLVSGSTVASPFTSSLLMVDNPPQHVQSLVAFFLNFHT